MEDREWKHPRISYDLQSSILYPRCSNLYPQSPGRCEGIEQAPGTCPASNDRGTSAGGAENPHQVL